MTLKTYCPHDLSVAPISFKSENEFKETEHKAGAMLQALKEASK